MPRCLLCADGGKVSAATKQATVRGGMMEAEARGILNVKPKAPDAEVQEVRMHTGSGSWASNSCTATLHRWQPLQPPHATLSS